MAYVERDLPLLVEPDVIHHAKGSNMLSANAITLNSWMTAIDPASHAMQAIIHRLGGLGINGAARYEDTPRPKVCIGRSAHGGEVLLIYKNTGGSATADNMRLTPLVSAPSRAQIKLDISTPLAVTFTHQCVALQPWLDEAAWTMLGLAYSETKAIAAWKRHLVRVWVACFPDANIKEAGSRTKGDRSAASSY